MSVMRKSSKSRTTLNKGIKIDFNTIIETSVSPYSLHQTPQFSLRKFSSEDPDFGQLLKNMDVALNEISIDEEERERKVRIITPASCLTFSENCGEHSFLI